MIKNLEGEVNELNDMITNSQNNKSKLPLSSVSQKTSEHIEQISKKFEESSIYSRDNEDRNEYLGKIKKANMSAYHTMDVVEMEKNNYKNYKTRKENIEYDENAVDSCTELLNEMYNSGYESSYPDKLSEIAFRLYAKKIAGKKQIEKLENDIKIKTDLIQFDEEYIGEAMAEETKMQKFQSDSKIDLQFIGGSLEKMKSELQIVSESQKVQESKSRWTNIKERISGAFSKSKRLPEGTSTTEIIRADAQKISNFMRNVCFKVMNNYDEKESTEKLRMKLRQRAAVKQRGSVAYPKRNIENKTIEQNEREKNGR